MTIEGLDLLAMAGATLATTGVIAGVCLIPVGWGITAFRRHADRVQRQLGSIEAVATENRTAIAGIVAVRERDERRLERMEKKIDRILALRDGAGRDRGTGA